MVRPTVRRNRVDESKIIPNLFIYESCALGMIDIEPDKRRTSVLLIELSPCLGAEQIIKLCGIALRWTGSMRLRKARQAR
jgi:hypothetical protein